MGLKAALEAVVAVTSVGSKGRVIGFLTAALLLMANLGHSAVLPEDRADAMYHSYDGGGVTIDGPAVLVRKSVSDNVSISAEYYVDEISSASIDVMVLASPYSEERTQYSINADYLLNKTIISAGYTNSSENDYEADTYFLGVSQDFFGDLSTLSLTYSNGSDTVTSVIDDELREDADHQSYQVSWSQVVTKNLLMNFIYQVTTDEGFLRNPYRQTRYLDGFGGMAWEAENYPETRTSHAAAVRGRYFLPYRAALSFEYRRFNDTWEIDAYNLELGYTHPLGESWILEFKQRFYSQSAAVFYSDLFNTQGSGGRDFRARDKEMSDFESQSFGISVAYEFKTDWSKWLEKGSVNLSWTTIQFDYNNFRDASQTQFATGEEPLYSMDADVIRFFVSAWF